MKKKKNHLKNNNQNEFLIYPTSRTVSQLTARATSASVTYHQKLKFHSHVSIRFISHTSKKPKKKKKKEKKKKVIGFLSGTGFTISIPLPGKTTGCLYSRVFVSNKSLYSFSSPFFISVILPWSFLHLRLFPW